MAQIQSFPNFNKDDKEHSYRTLPMNIEAEQALLGALLIKNDTLEKVNDFLKAVHFYDPAHQKIYETIVRVIERGQVATPITLKGYFEGEKTLENIGGADYLADLTGNVVGIINAKDYAQTVYEAYLRRQLIDLGEDIVNEAYSFDLDSTAAQQIEESEKKLFNLALSGDINKEFTHIHESITDVIATAERAYKNKGKVTGITTGFDALNKLLGGLHPSDLLILAGRPAMGKTGFVCNLALNIAKAHEKSGGKEGGVVAIFSLEMSHEQLGLRMLATESNVSSDKIRKGLIEQKDFAIFSETAQYVSKLPLYIDDTPSLTISSLRTRARRLKRMHGLDVIIIDYLQLMQGSSKRQEGRVQEISEISRGLKGIAKELNVPVIALSQLSRAVETREDKRPLLSDLRESGSIEQDADVVMFIFREEYYLEKSEPKENINDERGKHQEKYSRWREVYEKTKGKAEIIIAKHRQGPIGTAGLTFDAEHVRFGNDANPKTDL